MNGAEFVRTIIGEMHGAMMADVKDLTQEHLAWRPAPGANPIGFLFWHYVRTEDNMLHSLMAKPSVWQAEKWGEKLGMDAQAQGTGFQESDVDKAAALPASEVIAYAEKVFADTTEYLNTLDDAKLDYAPNPKRPRGTIGMMLRNFIVAHGWWHLGEIKYVKGMQGMPAAR
ncbi:MAG: DinB family protein [Dehalococcoidales bacterium]|nr:DinB family protein [Dehalococcoidales bacterium]